MAGTYEQAKVGDTNASAGPKWVAQFLGQNEALDSSNKTPSSALSLGNMGRWYAPTIIATEQERENVAFGTLTTADEVKSVVLPENGLIVIGYDANVKSSAGGAGRIAVFLGANQLKADEGGVSPSVQEASTFEAGFTHITSSAGGLVKTDKKEWTGSVTTGQVLGRGFSAKTEAQANGMSGLCYVFAAAGTYNVSVQYKATSGKVIAKERKLWVGVIGV